MEVLKQLIVRKHNDFFINLKNNKFNPELFFEAVSMADANYNKLSEKDMKLRILLLRAFIWECLKRSFKGADAELKTEFNMQVKSKLAIKLIPVLESINGCMRDDEVLLSKFYREFKIDIKKERKEISFPDIKQKYSIGVVKSG